MHGFFAAQLDYIFFIYGLSFILLSITLYNFSKLPERIPNFRWLALFAAFHGLLEWCDMVALDLGDTYAFKAFRLLFLAISFLFLLEFARQNAKQRISPYLYAVVVVFVLAPLFIYGLAEAQVAVRYFGAILGSVGAAVYLYRFAEGSDKDGIYYKNTAYLFLFYALVGGLIGPNGNFLLASLINQDTFAAIFGFPIQLMRAITACLLALNMWLLWQRIHERRAALFGIATHNKLASWIAVSIALVVVVGWLLTVWHGAIADEIFKNADELAKSLREHRLVQIAQTGIVALVLSMFFLFVKKEYASKIELDVSNKLLDAILDSTPNPIFVKDASGRYVTVNKAFGEIYGVEHYMLIGCLDEEFLPLPFASIRAKDDNSKRQAPLLLDEQVNIGSESKFLQTMISSVPSFAGYLNVGICTDVTHLRQHVDVLEEKIKDGIDRLREKDHIILRQSRTAAMGELLGAISHQWRQPLSVLGLIIQDIELSHKNNELNDKYISDNVAMGMENIRYMSKMIDDFRDFFKPSINSTAFRVDNVIKDAVFLLGAQWQADNVSIKVNCDAPLFCSCGEQNEFTQVLLVLLANAKDAYASKEIGGDVEINVEMSSNGILISVQDYANGIDDAVFEKIFDPYFTTKHQSIGTGLGLYMSKMIIEQHFGGSIWAKNQKGGACFYVLIPLAPQVVLGSGELS